MAKKQDSRQTSVTKRAGSSSERSRKATARDFEGASSIAMTRNKIVVTRVNSVNTPGKYVKTETRTYFDKTPGNLRAAAEAESKAVRGGKFKNYKTSLKN